MGLVAREGLCVLLYVLFSLEEELSPTSLKFEPTFSKLCHAVFVAAFLSNFFDVEPCITAKVHCTLGLKVPQGRVKCFFHQKSKLLIH